MDKILVLSLIIIFWFLSCIILCIKYNDRIIKEYNYVSQLTGRQIEIRSTTRRLTSVTPVATAIHVENVPENGIIVTIE